MTSDGYWALKEVGMKLIKTLIGLVGDGDGEGFETVLHEAVSALQRDPQERRIGLHVLAELLRQVDDTARFRIICDYWGRGGVPSRIFLGVVIQPCGVEGGRADPTHIIQNLDALRYLAIFAALRPFKGNKVSNNRMALCRQAYTRVRGRGALDGFVVRNDSITGSHRDFQDALTPHVLFGVMRDVLSNNELWADVKGWNTFLDPAHRLLRDVHRLSDEEVLDGILDPSQKSRVNRERLFNWVLARWPLPLYGTVAKKWVTYEAALAAPHPRARRKKC